ncbi:MAG: hypothetical protein F6J93_24530 [Oscillatoria sp. SIO1A7]|nr:hypothetical protein [Oscillatoria sp. SIO1A7]
MWGVWGVWEVWGAGESSLGDLQVNNVPVQGASTLRPASTSSARTVERLCTLFPRKSPCPQVSLSPSLLVPKYPCPQVPLSPGPSMPNARCPMPNARCPISRTYWYKF